MKRAVILAMVLALALCLTAGAQAAAFPPKSMCLYSDYWGDYATLLMKSAGSVTTYDGKVTFYAITGEWVNYWGLAMPVSGAGRVYYDPDPVFHISLTGAIGDSYGQYGYAIEAYFDASLSGYFWMDVTDAWNYTFYYYEDSFSQEDCRNLSFPYNGLRAKGDPSQRRAAKPMR